MSLSMNIGDRISAKATAELRSAIEEASQREILAVGRISEDGLVEDVSVAARGNDVSVPALMPHIEGADVVIHNHPTGVLYPSDADINAASMLGNQGIGFFIVDNQLENIYVVAEPLSRRRSNEPLDIPALQQLIGPGGALSERHSHYEPRESQVEMLRAVAQAFNDDSIGVVEAGTGVGKSLAYLVPAMAWAARNDERVVVATATINLQQQLLEKDVPLVRQVLGKRVKTVLVKGRSNYLCLRRLADAVEEGGLFQEENESLRLIDQWSRTTATGSLDDLSYVPEEGVWSRVCSESDSCTGLWCTRRADCFVMKARREAAEGRVLVTNHHLLFSDLSIRLAGLGYEGSAVLPPFQRLIIDEAHAIERNATSYFSESISRASLDRSLSLLYREKKGRRSGLLIRLSSRVDPSLLQQVPDYVMAVRKLAEACEDSIRTMMDERTIRLSESTPQPVVEGALEPLRSLGESIAALILPLQRVLSLFDEDEAEPDPEEILELRVITRRLRDTARVADMFGRYREYPDKVFWIEKGRSRRGGGFVNYNMTPIEISAVMREAVFEAFPTVVCTSATLTIRQSFSFWAGRVGLDDCSEERLNYCMLPSPFPYESNVLLSVPTDAPEPHEAGYVAFLSTLVREVLEISQGSALVLFTSYEMLMKTFDAVAPHLANLGIVSMKQGEDDRARLLRRFTEDASSVLFATDSFWQGVDAPGDALRVVIVCRLPFQVPNDPVLQARLEAIAARNGNPFAELALPAAVMRLKQGFGRLMRRSSDRGVVLIVDPRVLRKRYGAVFLKSLPRTARSFKRSQQIISDVEDFLYPAALEQG